MRIVVTGGNGYIASLTKQTNPDIDWVSIDRAELDLSNPEAVAEYFEKETYDAVFHTGAMAQTADCENYPELTHRINVESTIEIAKACQRKGARLIMISTEQVLNGLVEQGPFNEETKPCSVTKYGQHKIECEDFINENLTDFVIFRFSWMLGMSRPGVKASPNIIKNVMNAMFYQKPTKFTCNEKRCMTYAQHLADAFKLYLTCPSGTYHFASMNDLTTYESAKLVARKLGFDEEKIAQYILPDTERYADRFRDYRLDASKSKALGADLRTFEEDVELCLRDYGYIR